LAQADADAGLYVFAIRDYLKIPNLYPDSRRAAEARFNAGTLQALLGNPGLAIEQWRRVREEYPEAEQARLAQSGMAAWRAVGRAAGMYLPEPLEAAWTPFRSYGSQPDRGLSYAEDLYENEILEYALQEYAKVLCGIYTQRGDGDPHRAYARYRMGVCAYRLGDRDAAARQWRRLTADAPDDPWSAHAQRALSAVAATDAFSSDAGRPAPALPTGLPSPLVKRHHLADQLTDCGLPHVAVKEHLKVMFVLTAGRPNPFQAEACYKLGRAQHLRGRSDLALAAWNRVAEEYPDTPWAERARSASADAERRERVLDRSLTDLEAPSP
jgi:TolA-binding protein